MPVLSFEALPNLHEDHKAVQEGNFLVLCAAEGPIFIKKSTSRSIRTGIKLQVPANHLCGVAHRQKCGNGSLLSNIVIYTPSLKLGENGKFIEGSEGEGITGEISVLVTAPTNSDLTVRIGEQFAVAFLFPIIKCSAPEPKRGP